MKTYDPFPEVNRLTARELKSALDERHIAYDLNAARPELLKILWKAEKDRMAAAPPYSMTCSNSSFIEQYSLGSSFTLCTVPSLLP